MMKRAKSWAAALALLAMAGTACAAFVKNGDGTITDTSTNLIWLQNWNFTGKQSWATQKAWAENLTYAGSSDWGLPSIDDNIDLRIELGGAIGLGGFANVALGDLYWSGTEFNGRAFLFSPFSGNLLLLSTVDEDFKFHAVALRAGDVAAPVPEPRTLALALLALVATAVTRARRST